MSINTPRIIVPHTSLLDQKLMTAADAVVFFSNQVNHSLRGVANKTGLNINMHGRPNNLGTSFLNNAGIEPSSQICVSGNPAQVCDELRALYRGGMRFNISTALFELHESLDPTDLAELLHDLTPEGMTFVADYEMDGLSDTQIDALTTSDAEQRMKAKKGTDAWRRVHGRFSAGDVGKWMMSAGFGWMNTLPLAAKRAIGVGIGRQLFKKYEFDATLPEPTKAGESAEEAVVACY